MEVDEGTAPLEYSPVDRESSSERSHSGDRSSSASDPGVGRTAGSWVRLLGDRTSTDEPLVPEATSMASMALQAQEQEWAPSDEVTHDVEAMEMLD